MNKFTYHKIVCLTDQQREYKSGGRQYVLNILTVIVCNDIKDPLIINESGNDHRQAWIDHFRDCRGNEGWDTNAESRYDLHILLEACRVGWIPKGVVVHFYEQGSELFPNRLLGTFQELSLRSIFSCNMKRSEDLSGLISE